MYTQAIHQRRQPLGGCADPLRLRSSWVSCALPGAWVCVTSELRSRDQQITWVFPSRLDFALKPLSAKAINMFTGAAGFPCSEGVLCLGWTGWKHVLLSSQAAWGGEDRGEQASGE